MAKTMATWPMRSLVGWSSLPIRLREQVALAEGQEGAEETVLQASRKGGNKRANSLHYKKLREKR